VGGPPHGPQASTELDEFFDLSIDLLCIVGFDGYFKRVNAALARTLGYPARELFSLSVFEVTHPDDREPSREALAKLQDGQDLVGFESRVICADGSVRWLEWNTHTMPERGVVYGVARDTTERRRTDAELREAHRLLGSRAAELTRLVEEQAALKRVATLVAQETAPELVFAAVGREVGEVLGVDATHLGRYEADGTILSVAQWGENPGVPVGATFPLEGDSVSARVLRTGEPARMDGYENAPGVIAATVRDTGIRFAIGVPISVEGSPWGVMIATSRGDEPFPSETESRLQHFTELVATAVANASARARIRVLAEEQAALRRVATLVAQQAPQAAVFHTIAEEIGRLLAVDSIEMVRYQDEREAIFVAGWGALASSLPSGTRARLGGDDVTSLVFRSGRPARIDDHRSATGPIAEHLRAGGVRAAVGAPILAEGRLWGVVIAASTRELSLPADTEARMVQFTELMATAIANAEARAEVARLADEQAALRRVATLVAQGRAPAVVFDAVTREVCDLMDASAVVLGRYGDDVLAVVATSGEPYVEVGERYPLGGANVTSIVKRTGRPARLDDWGDTSGRIGEVARAAGIRATVAAPVTVEGRTWGVLVALWEDPTPPADDTEERLAGFAEMLDTAIANAHSRDELAASRARVITAGDDARRRVVRDLHDGAQQRLIHTTLTLKLAQRALREDRDGVDELLTEALENAERATEELRELAHGILPSVLSRGGLRAAVVALAGRTSLPVEVDVTDERLAPDLEASAYFILAEAITNVVKHARATRATATASIEDGVLTLEVRDDGIGGADLEGHGLLGIADRVDALGGRMEIGRTSDGGTGLTVRLPLTG
jgi:PAS domain S-box-containing protein